MKTCWAIRNLAFEDLDGLGPLLEQAGFAIRYIEAPTEHLTTLDALEPDLLVVLGGPIGVYQHHDYPFLADEIDLVRRRLTADRPTLGICLGCQIMAAALGARVYANPAGPEIGWSALELTPEGEASPLLELAGTEVLHWHGDTFDLPHGAIRLASTPLAVNQAFSWGDRALALQFHAEVTPTGLERWYVGHAGEIARIPGLSVAELRAQARVHGGNLMSKGGAALARWVGQACA